MKVTILGCSGSVGAPDNPASGYLIETDNAPAILMDIGPGVLAQLQALRNPSDAHVLFSHLHPDHCLDFPSLLVWRRYHPQHAAKGRNLCFGPAATETHMSRMDDPTAPEDLSDTFAFGAWTAHQTELVDTARVTPYPTIHPVESYALRVETQGKTIAYSGDSAYTEELVACATDADLFLCEATWGTTSEGKAPDMHLSGQEAGAIAAKAGAKKLVLVHIPPWSSAEDALTAAREEFNGPVEVGRAGMRIVL